MKPSYDDDILTANFHGVDPALYEDPIVGPCLRKLGAEDPDVIAAVAEVDRSQIRQCLALTPEERVRRAVRLSRLLSETRRERRD